MHSSLALPGAALLVRSDLLHALDPRACAPIASFGRFGRCLLGHSNSSSLGSSLSVNASVSVSFSVSNSAQGSLAPVRSPRTADALGSQPLFSFGSQLNLSSAATGPLR